MNYIKYFTVILAVSIGMNCTGQSKRDKVIYYRQFLNSTGEISELGDTIYKVSIEVNSVELQNHRSITIISKDFEFTASTDTDSLESQPRLIQSGPNIRIDAGLTAGYQKCIVVAQTLDSRTIHFINQSEKFGMNPRTISSVIIPHARTTNKPKKEKEQPTNESTISNSSTPQ